MSRGADHQRGDPVGPLASSWVAVDGFALHVRRSVEPPSSGDPPVVLVHGAVVSSRYLVPLGQRLAPYYQVYIPDLPGYGRSAKPRRALEVPQLAAALRVCIGGLVAPQASAAPTPVHLVANSFGCQIVVEFAARYPQWVGRLVLLGPTVEPRQRFLPRLLAGWLVNMPLEPRSLDGIALRDLRDMGLPRAVGTLRAMLRDRIETKLARVQAPTLVVRGGWDTTVPQRWAERVTALLPHGRLAVIPRAPHTLNYNAPRQVAQLVRAFLDESRSPGET
jgi:pimeloyl-ACP methyl ester carboxylesterase